MRRERGARSGRRSRKKKNDGKKKRKHHVRSAEGAIGQRFRRQAGSRFRVEDQGRPHGHEQHDERKRAPGPTRRPARAGCARAGPPAGKGAAVQAWSARPTRARRRKTGAAASASKALGAQPLPQRPSASPRARSGIARGAPSRATARPAASAGGRHAEPAAPCGKGARPATPPCATKERLLHVRRAGVAVLRVERRRALATTCPERLRDARDRR